MFSIFKRQDKPYQQEAVKLYSAAMVQSRAPAFYEVMGVPDTLDGRFEMIALHVSFITLRLNIEHDRTATLSQALFDVMFADMDQSLRELGIGDMGIPRRMKHMMKSLHGRMHVYGEENLNEALRRNVYGTIDDPDQSALDKMMAYCKALQAKLDSQSTDMLLSGEIEFEGLL